MASLLVLEAKRQSLFCILQNLYDSSKLISTEAGKQSFLIRTQTLDKIRQEFTEVVQEINVVSLSLDPKFIPSFKPIEAFDELFCHIRATEQKLKSDEQLESRLIINKPKHRLPVLELIPFNGDHTRWPLFYQQFKEMIHDNESLTDGERVQYLISKLSGSALSIASGILPIAANYRIIWELLVEKFQDTRVLAASYLDKLLKFKPITSASSQSLDNFIEHYCASVAALKATEISDLSDFIITHVALSKLDIATVNLFEQRSRLEKIPTFDSLQSFVKEQSKIISRSQLHSKPQSSAPAYKSASLFQTAQKSKYSPIHSFVMNNPASSCVVCKSNEGHQLYRCPKFASLDPFARYEIVSKNAFCRNCLGSHVTKQCKSSSSCAKCNKRHHTSLHFNSFPSPRASSNNEQKTMSDNPSSLSNTLSVKCDSDSTHPPTRAKCLRDSTQPPTRAECLYTNTNAVCSSADISPTARVYVINKATGQNCCMRVLLDTGSNANLITESCCKRLNLAIKYQPSSVFGIGLSVSAIIGCTIVSFRSRYDSRCQYTIKAAVVEKITGDLPTAIINKQILEYFNNIPLADDDFHSPSEIDCVIGSGLFPHLLLTQKVTHPQSEVVAIQSTLGYLMMGEAECAAFTPKNAHALHAFLPQIQKDNLDETLQKFWELETVPSRKFLSPEEEQCENDFNDHVSREPNGRYIVALPFQEDPNQLGDSYCNAKRRLLALEKKLDSNKILHTGYNATIQEYIQKGFLNEVSESKAPSCAYYIPHRAVYRPDKDTSKIRIVLDASCLTSSGKSLNDILHRGPNLQTNIFDLLINFRLFATAISADLEKMFFQLKVIPEHRRFQRILFRFESTKRIDIYEFERVSFGLKCSPYLAMRVVRKLASDEGNKFPDAARVVTNYCYMDDIVHSVHSHEQAHELYTQLIEMFASAGFNLTKWVSNSSEFLQRIPENARAFKNINFDADSETKLIGLRWNPATDEFHFKTKSNTQTSGCTKRSILSATAALFDPLGLITPVTSGMKLLIQECWKRELGWDEEVPDDISKIWSNINDELVNISKIKIPRHIGIFENSIITLLGFADASEKCYGAVIYIRVGPLDSNAHNTSLLCAKSRIAPLKKISLARLELCAAHLLALLTQSVTANINSRCKINNIFAFSDSTITLAWIKSSPHRWQTFVANRTAAVQEIISPDNWYHVSGTDNPSDIISRPVTPNKLIQNETWFIGPSWITLPYEQWPVTSIDKKNISGNLPECKSIVLVQTTKIKTHPVYEIANRVSKWSKLVNATIFFLRFIRKLRTVGSISVSDKNIAETYIFKIVQRSHFTEDIRALKSHKSCSPVLRKLCPFLDDDEILRVGGRLQNAHLDFKQKHPLLLPSKDRIILLLIEYYHRLYCHTGPGLLIALLRQNYWILSARNLVRKVVHSCNVCFKTNPKGNFPLMGNLPEFRVTQCKPFSKCGVDYAGPLFVTLSRRRGIKSQKAYICLFVCLVTKALHIELVSDLSTDLFLLAFKRFISRRGPVSLIMSDGGRNFVGARRKLSKIYDLVYSSDFNKEIIRELTPQKIEFKINPPLSPHMGGIWESNIKCVKTHLFRVVGNQILTYEELNTVLIQIETLMNSRPLCVLSSDPSDPTALTPSHFLNLTPLKFLPAENLDDIPINRLQRYHLIDKLVQSYWQRWHLEYITSLQRREKWNSHTCPIFKGQIVIIREDNLPPLCWPLGVVEKVYPGKDGIVRVVGIKTKTGSYVRPVVKVCPLPHQ